MNLEERFWKYVKKDSEDKCWEWAGGISGGGYGVFFIRQRIYSTAHRIAWLLKNGPIPKGKLVCHHCDNRKCVNPSHLFIGSYRDNTMDMLRKGRRSFDTMAKGEKHGMKKLREEDVCRIRAEYKPFTMTRPMLAKRYNVHLSAIGKILGGKTWKYLLDGERR